MPARAAGGPGFANDRRSVLSSLLALSTCAGDHASIARTVACAVEAIGSCRAEGIFLDGRWQDIGARHREPGHDGLACIVPSADSRRVELTGVPWAWAYPMPEPGRAAGCLVVGAAREPAADDLLLLQILAQQATAVLAAARLLDREEQQAAELQRAQAALRRRKQVHDRLTQVAQRTEGQEGIARAVYELTGLPAAIEDCSGHLRAWAGPGRPDPYPEADPRRRDALLRRAVAARAPVRDGDRLISAALLAGDPVIVLAVSDPGGAAGDTERVAIEHATTVLGMEVARLHGLAETGTHRTKLGAQAYVQDLEDHLQRNLFGSGAADPESAVLLVRGALARGDQARAADLAEETAKLAAGNPGDIDLAVATVHAAGLVGRDPLALDQAARWYFAPLARAWAAEDAGLAWAERGDQAEAVARLRDAHAQYETLGATDAMARVRARLRAGGTRLRHWTPAGRPALGWASLTDTEKRIVDLVAEGLSNRQVADQMFLSPHTIAFHLRHIFQKLNVSSRVQLARASAAGVR